MERPLRPLLLVLATWAATGCEREPDELLYVVGKVIDEDQRPLSGVPVRLERNGGAQCSLEGARLPFADRIDAGTFAAAGRFDSNAQGDFLFELTFRDTRSDDGAFASPACFRVQASASGAESEISFTHPGNDVELAGLPVFSRAPSVVWADGGLELERGAAIDLSAARGSSAGWDFRSGAELAWVTEDASDAGSFLDAELLEDFPALTARRHLVARFSPGRGDLSLIPSLSYKLEVRGGPQALSPAAGEAPISRGSACGSFTPDGGSCALTDGQLSLFVLQVAGLGESGTDQIRLDLGAPRLARRLVARGLQLLSAPAASFVAEGSNDGASWTGLGELTSADADSIARESRAGGIYLDLALFVPEPIRYLRLRGTQAPISRAPGGPPLPLLFSGAREISVF